jgi:broad specificity phosphatase PhoE
VVARRIGLEPMMDARLMETDAGEWTDRPFSEIRERAPELFAAFLAAEPGFAFPGGESFAEQELRVASALEDVERAELPALVVCHGMVIRAAFVLRGGLPPVSQRRVANAALVPLDPVAAAHAELGGGEATIPS